MCIPNKIRGQYDVCSHPIAYCYMLNMKGFLHKYVWPFKTKETSYLSIDISNHYPVTHRYNGNAVSLYTIANQSTLHVVFCFHFSNVVESYREIFVHLFKSLPIVQEGLFYLSTLSRNDKLVCKLKKVVLKYDTTHATKSNSQPGAHYTKVLTIRSTTNIPFINCSCPKENILKLQPDRRCRKRQR